MYYCKFLADELQEEWERLLTNKEEAGFHQSYEWSDFMQTQGWEIYKIGLFEKDSDKLVGGCIAQKFFFGDNTNFIYISEGPILDYSDNNTLFWQWRVLKGEILRLCNSEENSSTTHFRIEPRLQKIPEWFLEEFEKSPINLQPQHTEVINLLPSEDYLLKKMKAKARYNIRLAEKNGVKIVKSKKEPKKWFKLYRDTFQRNDFSGKDIDYFKELFKRCPNIYEQYFAVHEGDLLAGSILIKFGKTATYLYGASSNKKRNLMAPYLLHWEMIKNVKEEGFKVYDFWGISGNAEDKEHDWYGLTQFKKKFGGQQLDFIGAFDYILQKDIYDAFIKKHES